MKKLLLTTALIPFIAFADNTTESTWTNQFHIELGQKELDNETWGDLDSQVSASFNGLLRQSSWPVSVYVELMTSTREATFVENSDIEITGSTNEFNLGVAKSFIIPNTTFIPYIATGLSYGTAEIEATNPFGGSFKDEADGTGYFAKAGIDYVFNNGFSLGASYKYTDISGESDIDPSINVEIGGSTLALAVGYHW